MQEKGPFLEISCKSVFTGLDPLILLDRTHTASYTGTTVATMLSHQELLHLIKSAAARICVLLAMYT